MVGNEAVSRLYRHVVAFARPSADLLVQDLMGAAATVTVDLAGGGTSVADFRGIVTGLALAEVSAGGAVYVAVIEPAQASMAIGNDFRAFSEITVPDIVGLLLAEAGFPFIANTSASFDLRPLVFQWFESDLALVTRLLDEEGMFYFFDDSGRFVAVSDNAGFIESGLTLGYEGPFPLNPAGSPVASSFRTGGSAGPEGVTVHGWNIATKSAVIGTAGVPGVLSQFDAAVETAGAAGTRAAAELDRVRSAGVLDSGTSSVPTLRAGRKIAILGDSVATAAFDGSYAVTAVRHVLVPGESGGCFSYGNSFAAVEISEPYQPPALAPPRVLGLQNAIVTANIGPDGLGEVKVRFAWAPTEETGWIRVVLPSGNTAIPDVDDEVLVGFVNGNPDRPIVMGFVYNGVDRPPTTP